MARVLLLNPPTPFPSAGPPLALCYLAAAATEAGHAVRVLDLAAPRGPTAADTVRLLEEWQPELVGVTLYTEAVLAAYDLVRTLPRGGALWVAGGVHATAVSEEPLAHGFDLTVQGEGEQTLAELAGRVGRSRPGVAALRNVAGVVIRDERGELVRTPPRPRLDDLDHLPPPHRARPLFDRRWYQRGATPGPLPLPLLTSRGCPGACTFCCNLVTGRRPRAHSVARVLAELEALVEQEGQAVFSVHDDAFTADRGRLIQLCRGIRARFGTRAAWWCESRVDHFDREVAAELAAAGCRAVAFGVESGDPEILRAIGKGITPAQVISAFQSAKEVGLLTNANVMLGFPEEGPAQLRTTLRFMQQLAPWTDSFSPLGILVPYPGTALYRLQAERYGFNAWWLDRDRVATLNRPLADRDLTTLQGDQWPAVQQALEEAVLAADFFRYPPAVLAALRECLEFRRRHNRQRHNG